MWPVRVVVRGVLGKHHSEVSFSEDQHPIGQLGPHRQHEAFGKAVRYWTAGRDLDCRDARIRSC